MGPIVLHRHYELRVFFAVPETIARPRSVIGGNQWFAPASEVCANKIRHARFDEFSDFGWLIDEPQGPERGPPTGREFGVLLEDAMQDVCEFCYLLGALPNNWNFGSLMIIDTEQGVAIGTNCDVRDTMYWKKILRNLRSSAKVESTFPHGDIGVRLYASGTALDVQQFAWEVPAGWGLQGQDRYPVHRFPEATNWIKKMEEVLRDYDGLINRIKQTDFAPTTLPRLGAA